MAGNDLGPGRGETAIDAYLARLRDEVRGERDVDEIVAEAEDHLRSAVAKQVALGVDEDAAVDLALRGYGHVGEVGTGFRERRLGAGIGAPTRATRLGGLALQVAGASLLVACSLLLVSDANALTGGADEWSPTMSIMGTTLLLLSSAAGTGGALAVLARHGRQRGPWAVAASVLLALGTVVSSAAWAALVWAALLGGGWAIAIAALGRSTSLPAGPSRALQFGYVAACVGTFAGAVVGDLTGAVSGLDLQLIGLLPGILLQSVGMWAVGSVLASEVAVEEPAPPGVHG